MFHNTFIPSVDKNIYIAIINYDLSRIEDHKRKVAEAKLQYCLNYKTMANITFN